MKQLMICAALAVVPAAAMAQDQQADLRLTKLETILITAPKTQPKDYAPDAKTASLLAEIAKEKAPDKKPGAR